MLHDASPDCVMMPHPLVSLHFLSAAPGTLPGHATRGAFAADVAAAGASPVAGPAGSLLAEEWKSHEVSGLGFRVITI